MGKDPSVVFALIAAFFYLSTGQRIEIAPVYLESILAQSRAISVRELPGTVRRVPRVGDFLTVRMSYRTSRDSVLYDSRLTGGPIRIPLSVPAFKGGMEEGLAAMSVNERAGIIVPADSIFEKTFQAPLPPYLKEGSHLIFDFELLKIETKEEVELQLKDEEESQRGREEREIKDFLEKNKMSLTAGAYGLYYRTRIEGSGQKAGAGKTISVKYTARMLDGTALESPAEKDPMVFKMGRGEMIKGFEMGLSMMRAGGKCTVVVPSSLGFLSMPHTPFVFEIELVSVN